MLGGAFEVEVLGRGVEEGDRGHVDARGERSRGVLGFVDRGCGRALERFTVLGLRVDGAESSGRVLVEVQVTLVEAFTRGRGGVTMGGHGGAV